MSLTRLRRQGGAVAVTIPGDIAASGDLINIRPVRRTARGRKTLAELLEGIDPKDMSEFNEMISGDL
ncbi:antitoxin [Salmonella enterica]|nr:antitoxin [Salmonella enterica]